MDSWTDFLASLADDEERAMAEELRDRTLRSAKQAGVAAAYAAFVKAAVGGGDPQP